MLRSGLRLVLGLACFCISALGEERASETMATLPFVVAMVGETRGGLITILAGGDAEPAVDVDCWGWGAAYTGAV